MIGRAIAIAPHDAARGAVAGALVFLGALASEDDDMLLTHLPHFCWHASRALASASFSLAPVADSLCAEALENATAAQVF